MTDFYDYFASKGKNTRKNYLEYFLRITQRMPNYPVIFVYDNEIVGKGKPLYKDEPREIKRWRQQRHTRSCCIEQVQIKKLIYTREQGPKFTLDLVAF